MNFHGYTLSFAILLASLIVISSARADPGDTILVSVTDSGELGSSYSFEPVVSNDGKIVVFNSAASNFWDETLPSTYCCRLVIKNMETGIAFSPNLLPYSLLNATMTPDGRFIAATNHTTSLFFYDMQEDELENLHLTPDGNVGNGRVSGPAAMTSDGCVVAFQSDASDLIDDNGDNLFNDDTNGVTDIFIRDRCAPIPMTSRVSVASDGSQANGRSWTPPTISEDGNHVAFTSDATNLIDLTDHPDGDINDASDVFVRDRLLGKTELINVTNTGEQGGGLGSNDGSWLPKISSEGRYVAFASSAPNLCPSGSWCRDSFIRDREGETTESLSIWNGNTQVEPRQSVPNGISSNGRYVVLLAGGNIWVKDRAIAGEAGLRMVHVNSLGEPGNGQAGPGNVSPGGLSSNGRFIVFSSTSTNLVDLDGDGEYGDDDDVEILGDNPLHIYLHQLLPFTAQEMIEEMIEFIVDLNIDNGISNSLDAKLDSAITALTDMNDNNDQAACNSLSALLNAIQAQSGHEIDVDDATQLEDRVQEAQDAIPCS